MNLFSINSSPTRHCRRGISLFEVLISILVASIGVTGVLVLIPFAVRSAQRGMDREAAINTSKNFFADFQAYGYHDPATWIDDEVAPTPHIVGLPNMNFVGSNIVAGWPYVIDPIGTSQLAATGMAYGQFPNYPMMPADLPLLNKLNLLQLAVPMDVGFARRIAMPQDLLVFDKPLTELGPPVQRYFNLDGVDGVKRQYNGRFRVASIVVPLDDEGKQYRIYALAIGVGDQNNERVFQFNTMPPAPFPLFQKNDTGAAGREFEQMALGGGDLILDEITPAAAKPPAGDNQIRNDDWLMLINYYEDPAEAPARVHNDVQLGFYRVIHASEIAVDTFGVTLQGADFDLFRDWDTAANNAPPGHNTYAILIPNILAVYQRTIRTEPDSTWVVQ